MELKNNVKLTVRLIGVDHVQE